MAFCDKEKLLIDGGTTCIDNRFILNYMPNAADIRSAVYLLGLTLSQSDGTDNSIDTLAQKLAVTPDDVLSAYQYWEELGLVNIASVDPPHVIYLAANAGTDAMNRIKPGKYAKFSQKLQDLVQGRMINPGEYNAYFTFLEDTTFQQDALAAVVSYCVNLKGSEVDYRYVLAVARNLLKRGVTTLEAVSEALDGNKKYDADLDIVFKALRIRRNIDHSDRQLYEKWKKDFGFDLATIDFVAKSVKTGGMTRLDALLTDYYKKGAMSVAEIEAYRRDKEQLYTLAAAIVKSMGLYYQNLDPVVDEYVMDWTKRGFDDETLVAIARYCFRCGFRTLNALSDKIDKLYRIGVTDLGSLEQYFAQVVAEDKQIEQLLRKAGLERRVNQKDRALYKIWTVDWNMPQDVLDFVAEKAVGSANPVAYVNKVLADFRRDGVQTLEQARKQAETHAATNNAAQPKNTNKKLIGGREIERTTYTDEELRSLLTALDDTEE